MVDSFAKFLVNNLMGSKASGTANVLPAVLTTWSNLLALNGGKTSYDLYKEQAREYINTAEKNAELIKQQGEIALRNLVYKGKLERGSDITRVGASGGNLTGSNLDVLVKKEKIRKMDEQTLKANYINKALLELQNGYQEAYMTYGTLSQKAGADKYSAIAAIAKGLEVYTQLSARDAGIQAKVKTEKQYNKDVKEKTEAHQDYYYARPKGEKILDPADNSISLFSILEPQQTSATDISADNSVIPFL